MDGPVGARPISATAPAAALGGKGRPARAAAPRSGRRLGGRTIQMYRGAVYHEKIGPTLDKVEFSFRGFR